MERFEAKNLGGIQSLWLVPLEDVTIPAGGSIRREDMLLAEGKNWIRILFTPQTAEFSDTREITRAGDVYQKRISFWVPSLRVEVSALFQSLCGISLAALILDNNNRMRLVYPLRMEYGAQVPREVAGYNGYHAELQGRNTFESPFVVES